MPGQDYPDHSPEPSRRSVLRRGAVVGAAGLAVAAGGGGALAAVMSSQAQPNTQRAGAKGPGPIVIYLADPASGEMDIFAGTGRTRHRNRAMASMVASMAPTQ